MINTESRVGEFGRNEVRLLETTKILTDEFVAWCQKMNYYPEIEVDGREYGVQTFESNNGDVDYFSVEVDDDEWRIMPETPGQFSFKTYLYGDRYCQLCHMSRQQWRQLVKDLPEIFVGLARHLGSWQQEYDEDLTRLKRMVEAGRAKV